MANTRHRNAFPLTGIVITAALLTACGSGTDANSIASTPPTLGQAVGSGENSVTNPAVASAPAQPIAQTSIPAQTTTPTQAPDSNTNDTQALPGPVEPSSLSQPSPIETMPVDANPVVIPVAAPEEELPDEAVPEILPTDVPPAPQAALPANASCTASAPELQASILGLLNEARASVRHCGGTEYAAAAPLVWNDSLANAASIHSNDMALHNFFSHTGSDGSSVAQRVDAQGYRWRTVGENIAAGQPNSEAVLDSWLNSPGHCKNIMNPRFTETAVVCVENSDSQYDQYWTNVFGTSF